MFANRIRIEVNYVSLIILPNAQSIRPKNDFCRFSRGAGLKFLLNSVIKMSIIAELLSGPKGRRAEPHNRNGCTEIGNPCI